MAETSTASVDLDEFVDRACAFVVVSTVIWKDIITCVDLVTNMCTCMYTCIHRKSEYTTNRCLWLTVIGLRFGNVSIVFWRSITCTQSRVKKIYLHTYVPLFFNRVHVTVIITLYFVNNLHKPSRIFSFQFSLLIPMSKSDLPQTDLMWAKIFIYH